MNMPDVLQHPVRERMERGGHNPSSSRGQEVDGRWKSDLASTEENKENVNTEFKPTKLSILLDQQINNPQPTQTTTPTPKTVKKHRRFTFRRMKKNHDGNENHHHMNFRFRRTHHCGDSHSYHDHHHHHHLFHGLRRHHNSGSGDSPRGVEDGAGKKHHTFHFFQRSNHSFATDSAHHCEEEKHGMFFQRFRNGNKAARRRSFPPHAASEHGIKKQQHRQRAMRRKSHPHPESKHDHRQQLPSRVDSAVVEPTQVETETKTSTSQADPTLAESTLDKHHEPASPTRKSSISKAHKKMSKYWSKMIHSVEYFLFPPMKPIHQHHDTKSKSNANAIPKVRGGVLMECCSTAEEHKAKVREVVEKIRSMHGAEGLRAVGFEYRFVACHEHLETSCDKTNEPKEQLQSCNEDRNIVVISPLSEFSSTAPEHDGEASGNLCNENEELSSMSDQPCDSSGGTGCENSSSDDKFCRACATRLFHVASDTMIDKNNRKRFIADGDMYDAVARLCQEHAQYIMERDFGMVWVTLWEDDQNLCKETVKGKHIHPPKVPIRALVNQSHPLAMMQRSKLQDQHTACTSTTASCTVDLTARPTVLIATGKGKVRAGVFSRQFLFESGIEASTAIPLIKEANYRQMNIVMVDPNAHGDRFGMVTFERSMAAAFKNWETMNNNDSLNENRDLYIISHSMSGAQLARYLLEKQEYYVPHIRAIAFTDSTHSIQWARNNENQSLCQLLESPKCVYYRCSNPKRDSDCDSHVAGEVVRTDHFWQHRFGKIKTCWAGTKEHSLTNWFAHAHIWEHFDNFLGGKEISA